MRKSVLKQWKYELKILQIDFPNMLLQSLPHKIHKSEKCFLIQFIMLSYLWCLQKTMRYEVIVSLSFLIC